MKRATVTGWGKFPYPGIKTTRLTMKSIPPKTLIRPVPCVTAPEFRAAHKAFSTAYSGPEQRNRMPRHLANNVVGADHARSKRVAAA